ncbi:hypothetical protein [Variovorax guangxiensis]|nr:hypothetical protein [Variovorax guangxiensis]MDR6857238.1 uncharacterized protein YneF (UPF0154 family) [Variovorax guangxiensis]
MRNSILLRIAIFIVVVTLLGGILLGEAFAHVGFFGRLASLLGG